MSNNHVVEFTLDAPLFLVSVKVGDLIRATLRGVNGVQNVEPNRASTPHHLVEGWGRDTAVDCAEFFVTRYIGRDGRAESIHIGHPIGDGPPPLDFEAAFKAWPAAALQDHSPAPMMGERHVAEAGYLLDAILRGRRGDLGLDCHTATIELEAADDGTTTVVADYFDDTARFVDPFLFCLQQQFPAGQRRSLDELRVDAATDLGGDPEAAAIVSGGLAAGSENTHDERNVPRVPKREAYLRTWVAAWRVVEPLLATGNGNVKIMHRLKKADPPLKFGDETLRKIIRAGQAGRLHK